MVKLIEDGDIDEWFNEQKEMLSEQLLAQLEKGVEYAKAKERFDRDFKKLLQNYDAMYRDADKYKERRKRLERPLKQWREWKKAQILKIKLWWKLKKEEWKKWRFEREYRKLFNIKKKKV